MDVFAKVLSALKNMGFHRSQVTRVIAELREARIEPELEALVRAALARLAPARA
jgi:Holliday junction resolvasome RuvABC DNA-binding subunit